jgi:uncharacterized membrane protein YphA (DoxX/SURF4 family)
MKNKILFVLSLLVGLLFINAGLNKFFNYMPVPADLPAGLVKISMNMMEIGWLMPLVATAEVVGGILLIFGKTRALGAIILFPVFIGIMLIHITAAPSGMPMAIAIALVLGWVIFENRQKYLVLVR